jgi:MoxR-like ATPase
MNESQATIESTRYALEQPFMVMATQNPVEYHGTYPLPEAQMDRFLVQLDVGYPAMDVEVNILKSQQHEHPINTIESVLSVAQVQSIQQEVKDIHMDQSLLEYIVEIVHATRHDNRIQLGVSPRGSLMLTRAAQASAHYRNRNYVTPDDIQWLIPYVLPHRILLTSRTRHSGSGKRDVIQDIVSHIKVPV